MKAFRRKATLNGLVREKLQNKMKFVYSMSQPIYFSLDFLCSARLIQLHIFCEIWNKPSIALKLMISPFFLPSSAQASSSN
jgi:hypothetical protein